MKPLLFYSYASSVPFGAAVTENGYSFPNPSAAFSALFSSRKTPKTADPVPVITAPCAPAFISFRLISAMVFMRRSGTSSGSAGGRGDDVVVDGAGATEILLLGEAINDSLGSCGSMNGGHEAFDNAEVVVDNLCHRSKAVGGAGSIGNELHIRSVLLKVYTADEHRGVILCRAGHDNDLCAGVNVSLSLFLGEVNTGALENVLNTQLAPGNEGSVAVGLVRENLNGLAVYGNSAVLIVAADFAVETSVYGVILYAVCDVGSGMARSVDGDDFDIVGLDSSSESQGTDAAETIDANFDH